MKIKIKVRFWVVSGYASLLFLLIWLGSCSIGSMLENLPNNSIEPQQIVSYANDEKTMIAESFDYDKEFGTEDLPKGPRTFKPIGLDGGLIQGEAIADVTGRPRSADDNMNTWIERYWNAIGDNPWGNPVVYQRTTSNWQLRYDWGDRVSPAPGVNTTGWSASFDCTSVYFIGGYYDIEVHEDDGFRLWIDTNNDGNLDLICDDWHNWADVSWWGWYKDHHKVIENVFIPQGNHYVQLNYWQGNDPGVNYARCSLTFIPKKIQLKLDNVVVSGGSIAEIIGCPGGYIATKGVTIGSLSHNFAEAELYYNSSTKRLTVSGAITFANNLRLAAKNIVIDTTTGNVVSGGGSIYVQRMTNGANVLLGLEGDYTSTNIYLRGSMQTSNSLQYVTLTIDKNGNIQNLQTATTVENLTLGNVTISGKLIVDLGNNYYQASGNVTISGIAFTFDNITFQYNSSAQTITMAKAGLQVGSYYLEVRGLEYNVSTKTVKVGGGKVGIEEFPISSGTAVGCIGDFYTNYVDFKGTYKSSSTSQELSFRLYYNGTLSNIVYGSTYNNITLGSVTFSAKSYVNLGNGNYKFSGDVVVSGISFSFKDLNITYNSSAQEITLNSGAINIPGFAAEVRGVVINASTKAVKVGGAKVSLGNIRIGNYVIQAITVDFATNYLYVDATLGTPTLLGIRINFKIDWKGNIYQIGTGVMTEIPIAHTGFAIYDPYVQINNPSGFIENGGLNRQNWQILVQGKVGPIGVGRAFNEQLSLYVEPTARKVVGSASTIILGVTIANTAITFMPGIITSEFWINLSKTVDSSSWVAYAEGYGEMVKSVGKWNYSGFGHARVQYKTWLKAMAGGSFNNDGGNIYGFAALGVDWVKPGLKVNFDKNGNVTSYEWYLYVDPTWGDVSNTHVSNITVNNDSGVMFQGFYWDVSNGWYNNLRQKASTLGNIMGYKIDRIWFPPPSKGMSGGYSMGYDLADYYDLGEYNQYGSTATRFGTKSELIMAIAEYEKYGIPVMADIVLNHRCGGASEYNPRTGGNTWTDFRGVASGMCKWTNNMFHPSTYESYDEGTFADFPDVCHVHPTVSNDLIQWGKWLRNFANPGFNGGWRFDMAKGLHPNYLKIFREATGNLFCVGEYWDANVGTLQNWISAAGGYISAFDFPLYYAMKDVCNNTSGGGNIGSWVDPGMCLAAANPLRSVTFVANHDTDEITADKMLAYAFILTYQGYPCIWYKDYFDYGLANGGGNGGNTAGNGINRLVHIRGKYGGAGPTIHLLYVDSDVLIYQENNPANIGYVVGINDATTTKSVTIYTRFKSTTLTNFAWGSTVSGYNNPAGASTDGNGSFTISLPPRGYRVYVPTGY